MNRVTSKDGTSIAYERIGSGPAVILVGGGAVDRSENAPLAAVLAERFTVYNYDRRGRGDSGDTLPYAVEREIEDIEALIAETGGSAHLYGVSSGGALVLEAPNATGVPAGRPRAAAPTPPSRCADCVDPLAAVRVQHCDLRTLAVQVDPDVNTHRGPPLLELVLHPDGKPPGLGRREDGPRPT
jgi:hypothetical protein